MFLCLAALLGLFVSFASGQVGGGMPLALLQRDSETATLQGVLLSHDGKPVFGAFLYLDPPEGELP